MAILDDLRAWVAKEVAKLERRGPDHFAGWDWCNLSPEEAEVFDLSLEDMPLIVSVFGVFQAIKDASRHDGFNGTPLCDAAREALNIAPDRIYTAYDFMQFAALFGVPYRKANAYYYKYLFFEIRNRLITFDDEEDQAGGNRSSLSSTTSRFLRSDRP